MYIRVRFSLKCKMDNFGLCYCKIKLTPQSRNELIRKSCSMMDIWSFNVQSLFVLCLPVLLSICASVFSTSFLFYFLYNCCSLPFLFLFVKRLGFWSLNFIVCLSLCCFLPKKCIFVCHSAFHTFSLSLSLSLFLCCCFALFYLI